jgi:hypothetical protein
VSRTGRALVLAILTFPLGCQPEEKIVRYKPFFTGLEGMTSQTAPVLEPPPAVAAATPEAATDEEDPTAHQLAIKNRDGSVMLIARTGRHLIYHIQKTLEDEDADLFARQVLCQRTRREFEERGLDPKDAYAVCKAQERELALLFSRMPMGEHSPNVLMEDLGGNTFRVKLTGKSRDGLKRWTGFDMVLEQGNWRLRWFVP